MTSIQKEIIKWEKMSFLGLSENEYFLFEGIKIPYMGSYLCEETFSKGVNCIGCLMVNKFRNEDNTFSTYCHDYQTIYRKEIGKILQLRTKMTIYDKYGNVLDDSKFRNEMKKVNSLYLENLKENYSN
jgi:hypothetical protein